MKWYYSPQETESVLHYCQMLKQSNTHCCFKGLFRTTQFKFFATMTYIHVQKFWRREGEQGLELPVPVIDQCLKYFPVKSITFPGQEIIKSHYYNIINIP